MSERQGLKQAILQVARTRSGTAAVVILAALLAMSSASFFVLPSGTINDWNNPQFWQGNPRLASPSWSSLLSGRNLPSTLVVGPADFSKYEYIVELIGLKYISLVGRFEYYYDGFPSELSAILTSFYESRGPLATAKLVRPDGKEIVLFSNLVNTPETVMYFSVEEFTRTQVVDFLQSLGVPEPKALYPEVVLFAEVGEEMADPVKASVLRGVYQLRVDLIATGRDDTADAEFRVYGQVHGLAGTDLNRRDLMVGLIWGAPVALAFGLSAAVLTSFIQISLGAMSAWYGGLVDEIVQRTSDVYLILPFLPILITVSVIYRIDLTTLILIVVLLSLLGGATKTARSMTLQVMTEQYIEAARSYGASRLRILFLYIMPRLIPYMIANIVLAVPSFVFLEAAMSLLGLGDPSVPTWGKIIGDAYAGGAAIHGFWWWILLPSALIILTAAAFALLGYALDKIVNPRLRER